MKDLPLPEVTEIKPVNQWADKLFAQVNAPATVTLWNQPPVTKTEWMMGWPLDWTDLKPLGMDKFQLWRQQHSIY